MRRTLLASLIAAVVIAGCSGPTPSRGRSMEPAPAATPATAAHANPPASPTPTPAAPSLTPPTATPLDPNAANPPIDRLQAVLASIEQVDGAKGIAGGQSIDCLEISYFDPTWFIYACIMEPGSAKPGARYAVVEIRVFVDEAAAEHVWSGYDFGRRALSLEELQLGDAALVKTYLETTDDGDQRCNVFVPILIDNLIVSFWFRNWARRSADGCAGWRPYLRYVKDTLGTITSAQR